MKSYQFLYYNDWNSSVIYSYPSWHVTSTVKVEIVCEKCYLRRQNLNRKISI